MNINIHYYDEVDSTNNLLKKMAGEGAENGTAVVAWKQTAGRGRLGRSYFCPETGVYLSVLLPLDDSMTVTAKAAVAVRRAIEESTDIKTGIKWVNDIIYKGKKVAGILAEAVGNQVVLGVGINLCTDIKNFPVELQNTAISLYKCPQLCDVDAVDVANTVIKEIVNITDEPKEKWLNEYRFASVLSGQEVKVIQADKVTGTGIVKCIDDNCALHVIDKKQGEMILSTGEVSIRLN